jgi:hypothetical protein
MSNVGALAANLHEGSRSEYLAQYVFASFGTAISVPHQEDTGVDLYCTMTERIGPLAWPRYHYTVQVKSTMTPWQFGTTEAVRWLVQHPLPLFLCVLDKSTARLRLYHTFPRFLLWALGDLPDSLELVPEDSRQGRCTQWKDGKTFSLSAPIVDRTITDLLDDAVFTQTKAVIEFWLRAEANNLALVTMGVPIFTMPDDYDTNTTAFKEIVFQWGTPPDGIARVRETLGKTLPWLAEAYRRENNLQGMARTALLLRYLYPDYEGPGTPNAPFVQQALNETLGLNRYVFDGVDRLGEKLDELLPATSAT